MKKVIAMVLSLAMCLTAFAGCANTQAETPPINSYAPDSTTSESINIQADTDFGETIDMVEITEPYSITFPVTSDPKSLAPWGSGGAGRNACTNTFYETLGSMNGNGELELVLAKSLTRLGTNKYEIEIYDYIYDSAGNHMTAADVVFSYEKAAEAGKYASDMACLDKMEANGDYTILMTLKEDVVGGIDKMFNTVMVVTKAAWESSPDGMATQPISTAPYILTEYIPGTSFTGVRNENYWQTDESLLSFRQYSYPESVKYLVITDKTQIAIAVESGQVDISNNIETVDYTSFVNEDGTAKDGYNVYPFYASHIVSLLFNCSDDSVCGDLNLRKAIAYCLDSATLAENCFGENLGWPCVNYTRPDLADYNSAYADVYNEKDGGYYFYNLKKAQECLKASSYDGETIKLIAAKGNAVRTTLCTLIQAYCEAVGIKVEFHMYESAMYNAAVGGTETSEFDIALVFDETVHYLRHGLRKLNMVNYTSGLNAAFVNDPDLQDRIEIFSSVDTWSVDTCSDVLDYLEENLYQFAIMYYGQYVVSSEKVVGFQKDSSINIMPGSVIIDQ